MIVIEIARLDSPAGRLTVAARDGALVGLAFEGLWERREKALAARFGPLNLVESADPAGAATALASYFAGRLDALDALAVAPMGTPFQEKVWLALRTIPVGTTRTYRELAAMVGSPAAVRAVGAANGANPIGLVLPCHRVIGSDGSLTGFAGGLETKRRLLVHEGALMDDDAPLFRSLHAPAPGATRAPRQSAVALSHAGRSKRRVA